MKCDYCEEERVVWLMHPTRDIPRRINEHKLIRLLKGKAPKVVDTDKTYQKCYKCRGWGISKVERELYNVDKEGNYLGEDI